MRAAVVAVLALALAAAAAYAAGGWRVVAQDVERGSFLVASAHGSAQSPRSIAVRVTSAPRAGVGGNWEARCDGKVAKGHLHARTPFTRVLALPVARPHACAVLANVTYATRGSLTLAILAR